MIKSISSLNRKCRACGSSDVSEVLSLKPTPLEDNFTKNPFVKQEIIPLDLSLCGTCKFLYLSHQVEPVDSYENYIYKSSVTNGLRNHYYTYVKEAVSDFSIVPNSLAVDIGSNDGSMLRAFKDNQLQALGIEPVKHLAESANYQNLNTINGFFTSDIADKVINTHGFASLVTANYMYANVKDLDIFTLNVLKILNSDGIFIIQTGYHPAQFKKLMFDYIYHEHYYYFSLNFIVRYLKKFNLDVVNAMIVEPKGGSLRIICKKSNQNNQINENINTIIQQELSENINNKNYFIHLNSQLILKKEKLLEFLNKIKAEGKKIVGFGASHSTTTLIFHFELFRYIDYLVDDNADKQGLYSPGYGLPVYPFSKVTIDKPEYILILAWQHTKDIKKKHSSYVDNGGHWIDPLPELIFSND